jgi:Zn-dependent protease with chaperone function
MSVVFYVPLLCALALAVGAAAVARRASPKQGSAILVAAALAVALAADAALGVLVGARLLDAAPVAALLGWRAETPGPIPVPIAVSVAAAVCLAFVAIAAWTDWRAASGAMRAVRALTAHAPAGEMIVVRSPAVLAHAVAGNGRTPGRIVVSDGMLRALDTDERRVLLAHERSHLQNRHDRYRRLVRLAARINPLLRPTIGAADLLLERWADEDAARVVGSRHLTARALARAALADAAPDRRYAHAGFAAQRVSTRVESLLASVPSRGARLALVLPVALGIGASLSAVLATHELSHLFDLLRGDG